MQKVIGATLKAIYEYKMIQNGDRVAVGISGGKDSLALLTVLNHIRKHLDIKFELVPIHINMNIPGTSSEQVKKLVEYIQSLGLDLIIENTNLYQIIFLDRQESNPCSLCSKMRRGALNSIAINKGCNKLALGHHSDDVIETFFLSLLYEGRLATFKPMSYLDRSDITLIRPFIYVSEKNTSGLTRNLPIVFNPCPANKKTQREYMKNLIEKLCNDIPRAKERMYAALTHPERNSLWEKPEDNK